MRVTRDSRISHRTAGGGYGGLRNCGPEKIANDFRNKLITPEEANDFYVVVLYPASGPVDTVGTAKLRTKVLCF